MSHDRGKQRGFFNHAKCNKRRFCIDLCIQLHKFGSWIKQLPIETRNSLHEWKNWWNHNQAERLSVCTLHMTIACSSSGNWKVCREAINRLIVHRERKTSARRRIKVMFKIWRRRVHFKRHRPDGRPFKATSAAKHTNCCFSFIEPERWRSFAVWQGEDMRNKYQMNVDFSARPRFAEKNMINNEKHFPVLSAETSINGKTFLRSWSAAIMFEHRKLD